MWSTGDISVATITDVRNKTSDIADAVKKSKMRIIVTKNDEPVGVFIPFEDFTQHVEGEKMPPVHDMEEAQKARADLRDAGIEAGGK